MTIRHLFMATMTVAFLVSASIANAVTLTATDTGFVTETGGSSKFDGLISPATFNYSVGWEFICPGGGLCAPPFVLGEKKSFFVFDLTSLAAPIVSATFSLAMPFGGYTSADPTETFILSATGVPAAEIEALSTPTSPADVTAPVIDLAAMIFSGLTDEYDVFGIALGTAILSAADDDSMVEIVFGPEGIAYLNAVAAMGGMLVIGGRVTTIDEMAGTQEVFSFSDSTEPTVTLTVALVPIPPAFWLLGFALPALLGLRRSPD